MNHRLQNQHQRSFEKDIVWDELQLSTLVESMNNGNSLAENVMYDEFISKSGAAKEHVKKWKKPSYSVLKNRYDALPHNPVVISPKKIDILSDPLRGKYKKFDEILNHNNNNSTLKSPTHHNINGFASPKYSNINYEDDDNVGFFLTETHDERNKLNSKSNENINNSNLLTKKISQAYAVHDPKKKQYLVNSLIRQRKDDKNKLSSLQVPILSKPKKALPAANEKKLKLNNQINTMNGNNKNLMKNNLRENKPILSKINNTNKSRFEKKSLRNNNISKSINRNQMKAQERIEEYEKHQQHINHKLSNNKDLSSYLIRQNENENDIYFYAQSKATVAQNRIHNVGDKLVKQQIEELNQSQHNDWKENKRTRVVKDHLYSLGGVRGPNSNSNDNNNRKKSKRKEKVLLEPLLRSKELNDISDLLERYDIDSHTHNDPTNTTANNNKKKESSKRKKSGTNSAPMLMYAGLEGLERVTREQEKAMKITLNKNKLKINNENVSPIKISHDNYESINNLSPQKEFTIPALATVKEEKNDKRKKKINLDAINNHNNHSQSLTPNKNLAQNNSKDTMNNINDNHNFTEKSRDFIDDIDSAIQKLEKLDRMSIISGASAKIDSIGTGQGGLLLLSQARKLNSHFNLAKSYSEKLKNELE
eukprot:gene13495-18106_t